MSPLSFSSESRWVRDGHLPYHNVAEILPGFMKLRDLDHKYLYQDYPVRREYILNTAYHIVKTVGLSELPGLDLRVYTSRFILDLHLPGVVYTNSVHSYLTETLKIIIAIVSLLMFMCFYYPLQCYSIGQVL